MGKIECTSTWALEREEGIHVLAVRVERRGVTRLVPINTSVHE